MAIEMVRKPSETPNISNTDDFIPIRYAYGNQNGYVKNKGNELSYTINGSDFIVNSGRVVLQGVESDINANGVSFTIDAVSGTRYYTVYYHVNLATNETSILMTYDTASYPQIPVGDDLTEVSNGTANLEIYHFQANNGNITNVEKLIEEIVYSGTALKEYDISKGTIEERLTNLGFKQGSISFITSEIQPLFPPVTNVTQNELKRQGNYVLLNFSINVFVTSDMIGSAINQKIGTIPSNFIPTNDFSMIVITNTPLSVEIKNTNEIWVYASGYDFSSGYITCHHIGYEANPLTN